MVPKPRVTTTLMFILTYVPLFICFPLEPFIMCPPQLTSNPFCLGEGYNQACRSGFFDPQFNFTSNQPSGKYEACWPGFYCSKYSLCMRKCSEGAYCGPPEPQPENGILWCNPYNYSTTTVCGGADEDYYCRGGYYCRNTTSKITCPQGSFCPDGSTAPIACGWGTVCDREGLTNPQMDIKILPASESIILAIVLFVTLVFWIAGKLSKVILTTFLAVYQIIK